MPKESKYRTKLEELGFKPVSEEMRRIIPRSVRRLQAAKIRKDGGVKPYFTSSDIVTYAKDETGCTWAAFGKINLTSLGFEDNSEVFESYLKARNQSDRRFN